MKKFKNIVVVSFCLFILFSQSTVAADIVHHFSFPSEIDLWTVYPILEGGFTSQSYCNDVLGGKMEDGYFCNANPRNYTLPGEEPALSIKLKGENLEEVKYIKFFINGELAAERDYHIDYCMDNVRQEGTPDCVYVEDEIGEHFTTKIPYSSEEVQAKVKVKYLLSGGCSGGVPPLCDYQTTEKSFTINHHNTPVVIANRSIGEEEVKLGEEFRINLTMKWSSWLYYFKKINETLPSGVENIYQEEDSYPPNHEYGWHPLSLYDNLSENYWYCEEEVQEILEDDVYAGVESAFSPNETVCMFYKAKANKSGYITFPSTNITFVASNGYTVEKSNFGLIWQPWANHENMSKLIEPSQIYVIDTKPPEISISTPENKTYDSGALSLTYRVFDNYFSKMNCSHSLDGEERYDGEVNNDTTLSFSLQNLNPGNHIINVSCSDGNKNRGFKAIHFSINNINPELSLSKNVTTSVVYPSSLKVTGASCPEQLNCKLYRNGIEVSNPDEVVLGVGTYKWVYNTSGNENYTAGNKTTTLTVERDTPSLSSSLDSPITYETKAGYSASESNQGDSDLSYILKRNGTQIDSGSSASDDSILGAGSYNYTYYTEGGKNWTSNSITNILKIDKKNAEVSLTPSTQTFTYPHLLHQSCSDNASLEKCQIYRNGTVIPNDTGVELGAGVYNYVVNISDNENYTNYQESSIITIEKANPSLSSNLSSPITYETKAGYSASESNRGDSDVDYILERNGTQITSGSEVSDNPILGVGTYNYTYYATGGENWTSKSVSRILKVKKKDAEASLNPSVRTLTYPESIHQYCSDNARLEKCQIYRNSNSVPNNTEVTLGAGVYRYVTNISDRENYTNYETASNLTIKKGDSSLSLTTNTSSPITYPEPVKIEGDSCPEQLNCKLYRNGIEVSNPYEATVGVGTYRWVYNTSSNENYTQGNESLVLKVFEDEDRDDIPDENDTLLGNSTSINSTLNLTVNINGSTNTTRRLNGTLDVVVKEGNKTRVSFQHNSSSKILNLSSIKIEKQSNGSSVGELLIRGLNLTGNNTKTAYVDNISSRLNTVCVADREVESLSNVTIGCTGKNETRVVCNNTLQYGYNCSPVMNGSMYKISGLQHSAVREQCVDGDGDGYYASWCGGTDCDDSSSSINPGANEACNGKDDDCDGSVDEGGVCGGGEGGGGGGFGGLPSCQENWTCSEWSECINGTKLRNCTDLNECGTTENKPITNKSCNVTEEIECTPDWSCTDWSECVNGTQTRECRDLNECGTSEGEPSEEQSCEVKEGVAPTPSTGITGRILQNPAPVIAGIILLLLIGAGVYWKKMK